MIYTQTKLPARYRGIDFAPTDDMAREAEQGLDWWRKTNGRGGNEMALSRAWRIRRKAALSPDVIRRTAAHMALLEERKQVAGWNDGDPGYPSESRIAWALLGGDAGFAWAREIVGQLDAADSGLQANQRTGSIVANALEERALGRKTYVVAPVVALVEGVVNGFLVTAEELGKDVTAWNGRPITLRHPRIGNQYVTANDPAIAARQQIGTLYNATFTDNKLRGEIWLDPSLCASVGPEALDVLNALREGQAFEVSTGYLCAVEDDTGVFDGKPYEGRQVGLVPDHLAVLPDEVGACSWADGCGTPRVNTAIYDLSGNGRHLVVNAKLGALHLVADQSPELITLQGGVTLLPRFHAQQQARSDAMVAFFLREQAVRYASHISQWPDGSEPTPIGEYHVTLAYLGETSELGIDYTTLARVISQFAEYQPAFYAAVSGVGRFGVEEGTAVEPVYLSVDSPEMGAMRAELLSFLESVNVSPRSAHGFTPHITLGYVPQSASLELAAPAPSQLAIDSIALAWGGNVTVFPLRGQMYTVEEVPTVNECKCKEKKNMAVENNEGAQETTVVLPQLEATVEIEPTAADQLVAEFGGVETVRSMLQQVQANARAEVEGLVGTLVTNSRCVFSADELRAMPVDTLRKLEASLRPADYSTRPATNSRQDDEAVTMYGQAWKPYQAPEIK